jgi:hypothetical protein
MPGQEVPGGKVSDENRTLPFVSARIIFVSRDGSISFQFCSHIFSSLVFCSSVLSEVPGGPAGAPDFLHLTGPCRHLGRARKSLVQTGQHLKSPFKSVRFRAS